MKRLLTAAPLVVLLALGVLFATFGLHHDPHYVPDALVGQAAPDETLPSLLNGAPTRLSATLKGPTLVNFFFSTCAPCQREAPALMALKSQGVRIVGVAYKEAPEDTRAFLAQTGDPFAAVLVDRQGRAALDWGVSGAPETFVVSPAGKVVAKHAGAIDPGQAQALLDAADRTDAGGGRG